MVKSKKPAKAKKKAKTKTVRKDGSVRTTPEAAAVIIHIADQLYGAHKETLNKMKIYRSSAKLAIDYLISAEHDNQYSLTPEQTPENNLYDAMIAQERGGA